MQEWICQTTVQQAPIEYTYFVTVASQDLKGVSGVRANVFGWSFPWTQAGPDVEGLRVMEDAATEFLSRVASLLVPDVAGQFVSQTMNDQLYQQLPRDGDDYQEQLTIGSLDVHVSRDGYDWQVNLVPSGDEVLPP